MPANWEYSLITKKKKVFEEKILDGKIIRPPGGALNVTTFNPHKKNAEGRPEYSGKAVRRLRQRARVEDAGGAASHSMQLWKLKKARKRIASQYVLGGVWPCLQPDLRLWPPELKEHRCVVLNSNCVNVCVTSKFLLKYYSRSDSISQRGPLRSD